MIGKQDLLQPEHILEARSVDFSGGIHFTCQRVIPLWPILESASVGFLDPVSRSPLPGGIKILQGEAIGIDALVAGITGLVLLVLIDLLTQGGGLPAMVRLDCLDVLRGR